ncbi:hypothetical protein ACIRJO_31265 [Streptomyces sp. NPDC102394]|uniref:hypothetical protein n=1 Tax=Streptomyces sp. NPDC102394 TaxID=3366167 RepID=UPI003802FE39
MAVGREVSWTWALGGRPASVAAGRPASGVAVPEVAAGVVEGVPDTGTPVEAVPIGAGGCPSA